MTPNRQAIIEQLTSIEWLSPDQLSNEPRYLVIGLIHEKHWSAIITYRGANIRIISVRRSRTEEVALYES